MKNKEIEELLNKLKNTADTSFFVVCSSKEELDKMPKSVCKFLSLNDKQAKLLLSYIEQLENNRDKAIEYIKIELSQGGERELRDLVDGYEVLKLLKGDSDE